MMERTNNTNTNHFVSADGKSFSAQYILDVVTNLAQKFARKKGHTMSDWDISNLASEAICEKVIPGFPTYDSSRPLEPWLWTIIFHEGCDLLRAEIRETEGRRKMLEEAQRDGEPYGDYTDAYVIRKENEEQYGRYLASIEDEQKRECMRLAGEHWKPAEIAKELGWPADKVHRTVCREKKKLEDK